MTAASDTGADPSTSPGGVGGVASGRPLKLSIVIPVYNGASSIKPLVERLHEELKAHYELEIVLVNDCSPDNSAEACAALAERHGWVRFIHLARNFGEHNAVMAGLNYCTGDCAVIMDDDFQNPPTEVVKLVEKLQEGYDVAYSYYETKKHNLFRNLGSYFNNAVASVMIKKPWGLYLSSFKAINRFTIDEVVKYEGPYPYIDGLILRATRNYGTQLVQHDPRHEGRSNYTLRKLMRLWLNMFTNFSILPLRVASIAGFVFALIGVVLAVVFLIEKLANPELPVGWTSTVVIILIISGVQLFALGMIGEYLGRLFLKDNGSPQFVVRSTQNCPEPEKRSD
ncbi:MAG: glycosyltransferase family 2 protein [Planctomycetota bacterium]